MEVPEKDISAVRSFPRAQHSSVSSRMDQMACQAKKKARARRNSRLATYRWGIQAAIGSAITYFILYIPPVASFVGVGAPWAVISTILVLDSTSGASIRKSLLRLVGTIMGGLVAYLLVVIVTVNETRNSDPYVPWVLALSLSGSILVWGVVKVHATSWSGSVTIGVITEIIVMNAVWVGNGAFSVCVTRTGTVALGVVVATFVSHTVMPNPARPRLRRGMADILRLLRDVFEPITNFEIGIDTLGNPQLATDLSALNASISRSDKDEVLESASSSEGAKSHKSDRQKTDNFVFRVLSKKPHEIVRPILSFAMNLGQSRGEFADIQHYLPHWPILWNTLQQCEKNLNEQSDLMEAAKNELSCSSPFWFPYKQHEVALERLRELFFHAASLFFAMDIEVAAASPESNLDNIDWPNGRFRFLTAKTPGSDLFAAVYGQPLARIGKHICEALEIMADAIEHQKSLSNAYIAIEAAGNAIYLYDQIREERRKNFTKLVDLAVEADVSGSFPLGTQRILQEIMGVGNVQSMSVTQRQEFWDSYWETRDRMSMACKRFVVFNSTLRLCCETLDDVGTRPVGRSFLQL